MHNTAFIASAALLASSAFAQSVGSAVVLNQCDYEVYVCDVPAADGGATEIDKTLQSGDTFTQQWTSLTNGDGWSMKLSKDTTLSNIMQYEYTYDPGTYPDIIWYDLSDVNGNPWNGNWEVTATSQSGTCTPRQAAYQYSTDDAYGMQDCPIDSVIKVTLCSGGSGAANASSSTTAASSVATTQSSVSTASEAATTSSSYSAASSSSVASPVAESSATLATTTQPTTLATSTTAVTTEGPYGATVTEVQTAIVTEVVTATYVQGNHPDKRNQDVKRHEHHARRHPHGRL